MNLQKCLKGISLSFAIFLLGFSTNSLYAEANGRFHGGARPGMHPGFGGAPRPVIQPRPAPRPVQPRPPMTQPRPVQPRPPVTHPPIQPSHPTFHPKPPVTPHPPIKPFPSTGGLGHVGVPWQPGVPPRVGGRFTHEEHVALGYHASVGFAGRKTVSSSVYVGSWHHMSGAQLHDSLHGSWNSFHSTFHYSAFSYGWHSAHLGMHQFYNHHAWGYWQPFRAMWAARFFRCAWWTPTYVAPIEYYQTPVQGDAYAQAVEPVQQLVDYGEDLDVPPAEQQVWIDPSQEPPPENANMIGLGMFGLIPNGGTTTIGWVQLASSNDGAVRGYYVDAKTNESVEVVGAIDKTKMIVGWKPVKAEAMTFETSIPDLEKKEMQTNVYDPKTKTVVAWQMVRVDDVGADFDKKD